MCTCNIIPKDVLERLAGDKKLSADLRQAAAQSARFSDTIRGVRDRALLFTEVGRSIGQQIALAKSPDVLVFDCQNTSTLPGTPLKPASTDAVAKRAFKETASVAKFYSDVFGRNSIDDAGMTMMSSIHFSKNFNNAQWNGSQMIYGDGDGKLFVDFTKGNDVIGHELTHGVTQYSLQLNYRGDAGGLNESMSDCFGVMFRQWAAKQDAASADWLIGADIMGPMAKAKGFTCLRNMAKPDDKAALAPQPTQYAQVTPNMDPHYSSGPPNLAFCTACKAAGGKSWETVGQVWYATLTTSGAQPNMTMPQFAARTRQLAVQLFPKKPGIGDAIDQGWKTVGL
jgi:Zn-dependent metalloprotease